MTFVNIFGGKINSVETVYSPDTHNSAENNARSARMTVADSKPKPNSSPGI